METMGSIKYYIVPIIKPEVSLTEGDGEVVCYLCLDTGSEPLRRDCACRGTDAGFVHLSCLAKYASSKSERLDGCDAYEFTNPWTACLNCHQSYQNELRIDIANEFVLFVRGKYPDDTHRQVEALYVNMRALMTMRKIPANRRKAGVTANVMIALIDRMKNDAPTLLRRYSRFKSNAYNALGIIGIEEGTEESARRAVVHFEKSLKVNESICDVDGIAAVLFHIADAKSRFDGGNHEEGLLMKSQELYESRISRKGEANVDTINAGRNYARSLQRVYLCC